ncbi:MAG: hypothetical protein J6T46_02875, partial [Victivallales bacterium]|nr:hypothetical protein [Victivallales bacterium]
MARLLRGNGFTVDFAWLESGRDPEKFLPAFDANMTLDDALRRPDAYDLIVVHKLFDLDKLRTVQEHFRHTALFVHDHDIYCPRHHYYTPFGRTNCHRRFQTLRCGFCAFSALPPRFRWSGCSPPPPPTPSPPTPRCSSPSATAGASSGASATASAPSANSRAGS